MRLFGGYIALLGGFIGVVGMAYAIYLRNIDIPGGLIFGLLIANGLYATWMKLSGRDGQKKKVGGPLSPKKKKEDDA